MMSCDIATNIPPSFSGKSDATKYGSLAARANSMATEALRTQEPGQAIRTAALQFGRCSGSNTAELFSGRDAGCGSSTCKLSYPSRHLTLACGCILGHVAIDLTLAARAYYPIVGQYFLAPGS